ncbi:MAG: hypothetical protein AAF901_02925 [Bacteroidota bacterium]
MRTLVFTLLFTVVSLTAFAQRRPMRGNIPQNNQQPTQEDIEERKRKMEERREEYIANFIATLEADDFQKVIIKQTLDSYFEKKINLYKIPYQSSVEREDAVKELDENHFKELEELISENDMKKIREMLAGGFDEKEAKKKKKKKKKNKNKD